MDIYCNFNTAASRKNASLVEKEQLKAQLLLNIRSCLSYLLPRGIFRGDKFYVGNVQGDKGKSLVVELSGSEAGLWHDFATKEGGDIIDLWAEVHRKSTRTEFTEVMDSIAEWLGHFKSSKLQVIQLHIGIITMKKAKLLLEYIVMMMIVERDIFLLISKNPPLVYQR